MRIHPLSDLHNEFNPFTPEVTDADVVILAGDIDLGTRGIEWARKTFDCPVLYVPGNHEFYRGHLTETLESMRAAGDERVHVLDRDEVVIGGVRFLGATMWTDFAATGNPPMAALSAQQALNDFRQIRTESYRRICPADLIKQAEMTRTWLRSKLAESYGGPTVVITHHAPTLRSLEESPHAGGPAGRGVCERLGISNGGRSGGSVGAWSHTYLGRLRDGRDAGCLQSAGLSGGGVWISAVPGHRPRGPAASGRWAIIVGVIIANKPAGGRLFVPPLASMTSFIRSPGWFLWYHQMTNPLLSYGGIACTLEMYPEPMPRRLQPK